MMLLCLDQYRGPNKERCWNDFQPHVDVFVQHDTYTLSEEKSKDKANPAVKPEGRVPQTGRQQGDRPLVYFGNLPRSGTQPVTVNYTFRCLV